MQPLLSPVRQLFGAAVVFVCLVLGGIAATALGGGGPVDIRGVYDATSHVGTAAYPQTWHVTTENLSSGAFTGVDTSGVGDFAIVGKVTGNSLTVTVSQGGYVSHGTAKLSVSGGTVHMTGTFVDSNGTKGTFGAVFPLSHGSSNPSSSSTGTSRTTTNTTTTSPSAKRPTYTAVVCTIEVNAPSTSTCAGQVADASVQRSNPPTGTVTFSATSGTVGSSCVLAGTPGSPGIASCTVSYLPSANLVQGEPPPVSAHYGGDSTFAPSSGSSSYKPASVLVPSSDTIDLSSSIDGIETDLGNPDPFPLSGDEVLTVLGNINATLIRAGARSSVAPKPKVIGHVSVRLKPLSRVTATVKLTSSGRKLLAKHKSLHAVLTVTTTAKGKPTKTVTRHLVLKAKS